MIIDPFRFAKKCQQLDRVISLYPKGRLDGLLLQESEVSVHLEGFRNTKRRLCLKGSASGMIKIQCQSCLEDMDYSVDFEFSLVIVNSEDRVEELDDKDDAIVVLGDEMKLEELITTELILAMPVSASHRNVTGNDCINDDVLVSGEIVIEKTVSPFDVLKNL